MTLAASLDRIRGLPRRQLAAWPTPLERLDRFSEALGAEVLIKRDDIGSVGLAGNKVRKYELILGAALQAGADTLVTTGAVQSNSARAGAVAAARCGLHCVLLLSGAVPDEVVANHLLDEIVGAEVQLVGDVGWVELNERVAAVVAERAAAGGHAVAAPVGASSPLGSLGFALAWLELVDQLAAVDVDPAAVVHASTSCGTHAGLLVGRALTASDTAIVGIDAGRLYRDLPVATARLASEAASIIGLAPPVGPDAVDLRTEFMGPAYAAPTEACDEAIRLLARTEGIIADPVYSGKGLAGLVAIARAGEFDGPLVFWHTGGWHALFDPHYGARFGRPPVQGRA